MKKLLAIAMMAAGPAFGYVSYTLDRNTPFSDVNTRMIRSVAVVNNGHMLGKSESVSLKQGVMTKYSRYYDTIAGEGTTPITNQIQASYTLGNAYDAAFTGVLTRVSHSSDPFRYEGDFNGTQIYSGETVLGTTSYHVFVQMRTDIPNYKRVLEILVTNLTGEASSDFGGNAYKRYTKDYDIGTAIGAIGNAELDGGAILPTLPLTNSVSLVSLRKDALVTNAVTSTTILSIPVGTSAYAITNGLGIVVLQNQPVTCTANDSQTKVILVCE